jgi:site-specific recombinase XerC
VETGSERSLESIGQPDLIRLAELAARAETRLFGRNPDGAGRYAGRLLCRAHATELINSGVSIEAVRRRLGHASTETTQIYTLLADKIADDEIRAARRRRDTRR